MTDLQSLLYGYLEGPGRGAVDGMNPAFQQHLGQFLEDNPYGVSIKSGYRSVERQQQLWDAALQKYGSPAVARQWVAPPGMSQHNHGTAADLSYEDSDAEKWAHANADKYGLHFPLGNENWHVEPVGARDGGTPQGGLLAGANSGAPVGMTPAQGQQAAMNTAPVPITGGALPPITQSIDVPGAAPVGASATPAPAPAPATPAGAGLLGQATNPAAAMGSLGSGLLSAAQPKQDQGLMALWQLAMANGGKVHRG